MSDMEEIIEDSVNDSLAIDTPDTTTVDTTTETPVETSSQVATPATLDTGDTPVEDEFGKRFGISGTSVTGRENRIPYSRVKKIVDRNEKETAARIKKELEDGFTPRLTEFETKVKTYEERLGKVAQFEHILENDPQNFLTMLSKIPAYKPFFDYIDQLSRGSNGQPAAPKTTLDLNSMPQPDLPQPDGTKIYSMEALAQRDEWLARQVEERAVKQAEARIASRYAPIEKEWQQQQQELRMAPVIRQQLAEAATWPQFTENQDAILSVLKADRNISLEGAYRKVVFPKLQTGRDEMRQSILAELKTRPQSTSVPGGGTKPSPLPAGKRSMEEIIQEQIDKHLR